MPREQTRSLTGKAAVPAAAARVKFRPQASPLDPYGVNYSPDTADLLRGLGALKDIAGVAGEVGALWAGKQAQKGAVARQGGEQDVTSKSNAFINGYEKMDGEMKGVEHKRKVEELIAKDGHLPPDEFNQKLADLEKESLGQLYHDGQIAAFSPHLLQANAWAATEYQKIKNAEMAQERNTKAQGLAEDDVKAAVDAGLANLDMDRQSLVNDPKKRFDLHNNRVEFINQVGPVLRASLDKRIADWKAVGLTRPQISRLLLESVGRTATELGVPELMAYAVIPDESGMSVQKAFPDVYSQFLQRAVRADHEINAGLREEADRLRAEAWRENDIDAHIELSNAKSVGDLNKLRMTIIARGDNGLLSPQSVKELLDTTDAKIQGGNVPAIANPAVVDELNAKLFRGTLRREDITAHRRDLNVAYYNHFMTTLKSEMDKHKDETKSATVMIKNNAFIRSEASTAERLVPGWTTGTMKGIIAPDLAQRVSYAQARFRQLVEDSVMKHGGIENVPLNEITAAEDAAVSKYETKEQGAQPKLPAEEHPYYKKTPGATLPPMDIEDQSGAVTVVPPAPQPESAQAAPTKSEVKYQREPVSGLQRGIDAAARITNPNASINLTGGQYAPEYLVNELPDGTPSYFGDFLTAIRDQAAKEARQGR